MNPKEYYEHYSNKDSNKRHKSVRKGTPGITFETFANRILSLQEDKNTKN